MRDLDVNEEANPNAQGDPAPDDPTELLAVSLVPKDPPPPTDPPPAPPPTPGDKHS